MTARKIEGIGKFGTLKVMVVGDVMLDIYDFCYSSSSRPSPEKPGKRVYTAARSIKTLGGAGNVAANLATLGATTSLMGIGGGDGHYATLCDLADRQGLDHLLGQVEQQLAVELVPEPERAQLEAHVSVRVHPVAPPRARADHDR